MKTYIIVTVLCLALVILYYMLKLINVDDIVECEKVKFKVKNKRVKNKKGKVKKVSFKEVKEVKEIKEVKDDKVYDKDGGYASYEQCYFDCSEIYPQLDIVDKNYDIIRDELFNIREKRPDLWHKWIENELVVFPILFFDKWASVAKELCPETTKIMMSIPDIKTASFSCLLPGQQIQPHKGWGDLANDILRCHYGIDVPDDCGCVCDNWVVKHKNREWLVFDDARMHSSYNFTNKHRFILIVDMVRPEHIPRGTSNVKYGENLLKFIESFYDDDDIKEMRTNLKL